MSDTISAHSEQQFYVWVDELGKACGTPKPYTNYQEIHDLLMKYSAAPAYGKRCIAVGSADQLSQKYTFVHVFRVGEKSYGRGKEEIK